MFDYFFSLNGRQILNKYFALKMKNFLRSQQVKENPSHFLYTIFKRELGMDSYSMKL